MVLPDQHRFDTPVAETDTPLKPLGMAILMITPDEKGEG